MNTNRCEIDKIVKVWYKEKMILFDLVLKLPDLIYLYVVVFVNLTYSSKGFTNLDLIVFKVLLLNNFLDPKP